MAQEVITRQEYVDWKRNPCTSSFLENLDNNCKVLMMNWSKDAYKESGSEEKIKGMIEAYRLILQGFNDNTVVAFEKEDLDA